MVTTLPPVAPPVVPAQTEAPSLLEALDSARLRLMALSRWENEGGYGGQARAADSPADKQAPEDPAATETEAVQLRIRVIALENLVIALLAQAPESQLALAREMADFISPRPGYTPHPLTLRAAEEMRSLVDRAVHYRPSSAG